MPPLPADFIHARACKPICEKSLTLPKVPSQEPSDDLVEAFVDNMKRQKPRTDIILSVRGLMSIWCFL